MYRNMERAFAYAVKSNESFYIYAITGAQAHENDIPLTHVYSHSFFCP